MAVREGFEQAADIAACVGGFHVGLDEEAAVVLEGLVKRFAPRVGAKEVHQLVACNGVHPGGERLVVSVGMSRIVHGEQGLLEDVFDVGLRTRQAPAQVGAKVRTETVEKEPVLRGIATQAEDETGTELSLRRRK